MSVSQPEQIREKQCYSKATRRRSMAIHIRKTWHSHASRNPRQGRTGSGRAEGRAGGRATGGPPRLGKKGPIFLVWGAGGRAAQRGAGPRGAARAECVPAIENKQPGSLMGRRKGRHQSPKSDSCAEKPEKLKEYRIYKYGPRGPARQGNPHATGPKKGL